MSVSAPGSTSTSNRVPRHMRSPSAEKGTLRAQSITARVARCTESVPPGTGWPRVKQRKAQSSFSLGMRGTMAISSRPSA